MEFIEYISKIAIPFFILIIVLFGIIEKKNVLSLFMQGVIQGEKIVIDFENGLTSNSKIHSKNPKGCLLWAKGQILSFPNDWRKRFLAIGIYHGAVKKRQFIFKTASELNVNFITATFAYLIIMIYKPLYDFFTKRFRHF